MFWPIEFLVWKHVSKEAVDLVNLLRWNMHDGWDVMLSQYTESIEIQIHVEDTFGSLKFS
jgi:hypothetical protein